MPLSNLTIEAGLPTNSPNTLVTVVVAWGRPWTVYTDRICLLDYHEDDEASNNEILAYNFTAAALGAEKFQCAIGFNGFLYVGTTQPDHSANARIIRFEPPALFASIDGSGTTGHVLVATVEHTISTATANEHSILNLGIISQRLHAYYQYHLTSWKWAIYAQTDHGSWTLMALDSTGGRTQVTPSTHYAERRVLLSGGNQAGLIAYNTAAIAGYYTKLDINGSAAPGGSTFTTSTTTGYIHIAKDVDDGWLGVDDSMLFRIEPSRGNQIMSGGSNIREIDFVDLYIENYGSLTTLSPAFLSAINFYGGIPYYDHLFIGGYLTEDDGGGSFTYYDVLLYREPDGNWVMGDKVLNTTGAALSPECYAPLCVAQMGSSTSRKPRIIAPRVNVNNFAIITPDFTGTIWTPRISL